MKRIFVSFLAAALVVTLAAPCASAAYYEPFEHPDVRYEDMPAPPIDAAAVDAFCERFAQNPVGQYGALLDLYDELDTQVTLSSIRSDCNVEDESLSDAYEQAENDYAYASDRLCAAISEALASPQGDALRALMPEDEADSFADYEAADDEDFASTAEENALMQEYYLLPYDDGFEDAAAEIYLKLAALRRAQAEDAGFDSYADYAYASFYAREYVPEDMRHLHRVVKSYLAPLYVDCVRALDRCELPWDNDDVPTDKELLDALAAHLGDVSPELTEALDFLRRNGLYRIGSDDGLYDGGYTDTLPAYRSAFLFNKVSSRFEAFSSTVHEFGHFNAAYHDPTPALYQYSNIDVSEIQSQGLELLFLPCLQDILAGEDVKARNAVTLYALSQILSSVVDGCLYDEFEQAVYAAPDLSVEDLHQLEQRLNAEYGYNELYEPEVYWTYISHLFEQPFYYISYATSALPALELWVLSREDYGAAVDAYMKISAVRTDAWFLDVLDENGLCDVTNRGDVVRLADKLERELSALTAELPVTRSFPVLWIAGGAAIVLAAAAILIARRARRRRALDEPRASARPI